MNTVEKYLDNILNQYQIWKSNKSFYANQTQFVDLDNFLKLPCYHYTDVESINQCSSDIVVIDNLTESIHSQHFFCKYDKTKYYVIFTGGTWDKDKHEIGIKNYDIVFYCFFLFELIDTYMSPHRFCFYLDKNYSFNYPKDNEGLSSTSIAHTVNPILNQLVPHPNKSVRSLRRTFKILLRDGMAQEVMVLASYPAVSGSNLRSHGW